MHPIADLQIEYSLISRNPERKIFPVLDELGIGVTAYGVLSRGLLSGSKPTGPGDFRSYLPRFSGENLTQNQRLIEELKQLASERGSALSACRGVGISKRVIIALVGARTRAQLSESWGCASRTLLRGSRAHREGDSNFGCGRKAVRRAPDEDARQRARESFLRHSPLHIKPVCLKS